MSAFSSAAPKFQGNPLKITTVKPWIRACFAQSSSNALQFLLSDGRRASLLLPSGTVIRDLQGLEACRDKIVKVSATHDGSCVAALTSDGHCWLHNCALGQSQAFVLPPLDGLPFPFGAKVKRQQQWDLQLEACAATSLVCFSWLGPTGNLINSMPFYSASSASSPNRDIVWAKHEEQTVSGASILGSCVCSASMMSLEGWIVITGTSEADTVNEVLNDSWKINISCLLFCMKESAHEPVGSCIAFFSFPSPFSSSERAQWSQRARTLQSSRQKPIIFAVHGGEGLIAVVLNCGSPCLYFFNMDSGSDKAVHPKISLPLDSASGAAQEFVCDAVWLCKGWWLVLLLSTGRLLVLDRRGVPLSPYFPGTVAMVPGTKENGFVELPRETLSLSGAEWTVSAHAFQPCVAVCTGFFISVILLPSPNTFFSISLSAIDMMSVDLTQVWSKDYASFISRASHVSSQPTFAEDAIVILSHLWCLALSNPVALEISNFDIFCQELSSHLVSLAADDSKSVMLAHSLRAFLTAGHQAMYLCPHFAVDQSQKLDFACIQVIVSALVSAKKAEDAAVLLCACRKRCDDSSSSLTRPQHISGARHIMNIWNTISVKALQVTAASEVAALQAILASEGISLSPVGSLSSNRENESIIARAISPSATVLESAVCFCRSGQSVAALCALINGGHVASVIAATLRMQGVLTGSSCTSMLSSAIVGKCWRSPAVEMLSEPNFEECNEDMTVEECIAFILKTSPDAAVHSVIRFAVAVGALSLCANSDIELFCLSPSQCIDTQSKFTTCPVLLRLRLSSDPSVILGNDSEREDCLPISARACSSALKDVLNETIDHACSGNSPPPGLELAWILCLVAGCGAEAALLAVASVQTTNSFKSLLSFCDEVSAAAIQFQFSDFAARVSNFKASVCDWINDNADSLSSLFLSSSNIQLLEFSSDLSNAHLSSHILLSENIDKVCSDAVNVELVNLYRHIAGDHNIVLNSNIKDACHFLSFRSKSTPNSTQLHILFFWAIVDSRRSALTSASGSISSKLSATAMIKAQLLLEFSIPVSHADMFFLHLSATCSVSALESILRSASGNSVSREHLVYFISMLCVAVRKGAIPEQRHKLRAIAQSVKNISLQAYSMINSLFESELSHAHDAEFQALETELCIQYELLKEAQSLPHDQGLMAELKSSADSVLGSLAEELWVCHCALIASCCLQSKSTENVSPVVLVPHLHSSVASAAKKLAPIDDLGDLEPPVSQNLHSLDDSTQHIEDKEFHNALPPLQQATSAMPNIQTSGLSGEHSAKQVDGESTQTDSLPGEQPNSIISNHRSSAFLGEHFAKQSDSTSIRNDLSPCEQPTSTVLSKVQPLEIPVEAHDAAFISCEQLLRPARKLDAHDSAINAIISSCDGIFLFSAGDDHSIKMWKSDDFSLVQSVVLDHAVSCLAVSSDGEYMFSGGIEIVVWTHGLRRVHTILKGCVHPISSMAITSDFVLHASSCEDAIKKFKPMNDDLTSWSSTELPIYGSRSEPAPLCAHPIVLSRSGNLFIGKNEEYVLRAQILPQSIALSNYVLALALSADEKVLAVGGMSLGTFRVDTGEMLRTFNWNGRWITCVALSHTAHLLYSAGSDCKVHIWDSNSGACLSSIHAHAQAVTAIILSQDQQWLYSSSKDRSINEWCIPSLPGMRDINIKPVEAPSLLEDSQPSESCTHPIVVETIATESSIAESERPSIAELAAFDALAASSIPDIQSIAVAPSMSDVLSGVRSDCSSSVDSDDDFDSNFTRINSAIERLQGSMMHHASPSAVNSAELESKTSPFAVDSEGKGYNSHRLHLFSRPQRLQILSEAKTILKQEQVRSVQPQPAAHFVVNLGDFDLSSDEKSSTAFSSPVRSPAVSLPSPSVVHGSLYMPVTSPQASPRQLHSKSNGFFASNPNKNSPSHTQSVLPQELRARARRQQEHIIGNLSSTKISRTSTVKRATSSSSGVPFSTTVPVRLLKISSPASPAQVAAAAGAPLLLPLPVQAKAERLSAVAPSLVTANTSNVRLLAPRPTPAIVPPSDPAPDHISTGVAPNMLVISPDELQQLVHSAVTSAMNAAVKPLPSHESTGIVDVQPVASVRSPTISTPSAVVQSEAPNVQSPQIFSPLPDCDNGAAQSAQHPGHVEQVRESRSAIVQTDGDELPRRAPSPLAQSTRQAINDAYNFSLPPSRHVQVLSVGPGAPVAPVHTHSPGSIEARSVAVMRGQPPVATEEILSPGKVSRMLLSGHQDGPGLSAATLDRSSLARQFSTQPDPVQLVSASLSAFERKLTMLEQQAAQVEHNLGISRQNQAQAGHSVLDSINSKLGAVLDNDVKPDPPLIPSQLSSALKST